MKKRLAVLTVVCMLFCLAACGQKPEDTDAAGEKPFSLGKISGTTYENEFIGIGCKLNSDWNFYTDAQLKNLNKVASDADGEELRELLEQADVVYDMAAQHSNGLYSMNVVMEKVESAETDLTAYLNSTTSTVRDAFVSMGYTVDSLETVSITMGDTVFPGFKLTATMQPITVYETQCFIRCGRYIASITVAAYNENVTEDILDYFYTIG